MQHHRQPPWRKSNRTTRLQAFNFEARHDKKNTFRLRAPTSEADLDGFVNISDEEPDIALANPTLRGAERRNLYARWCQWTAPNSLEPWHSPDNSPRSFLMLEHRSADAEWCPVAISIILPLSHEGAATLAGTTIESLQNPADRRTAVNLTQSDCVCESAGCLLIDTWAVARNVRDTQNKRFNHHSWGVALLLRHLAEFWEPSTTHAPLTILVEPNERMARVLSSLGFDRRERNSQSGDLYYIDYPLNGFRYSPESRSMVDRIIANLSQLSKLRIER